MIPLRDENPSRTVPVVTRTLIALNCVAFLYELALGPDLKAFIFQYGFVPERLTLALKFGEEPFLAPATTLLTSMFLHGGWAHLLGNMWYLWIFGDNVEDRLGKIRYIMFYLVCGLLAGLAHYASNPSTQLPSVGASGAIAAVLGAYAVTYPGARVITLIPFIIFFRIVALPALVVLGLWVVYQFLLGTLSQAWGATGAGTAWWAHIGGFLSGAIAMLIFRRPSSYADLD
jgi:membrane associated rhomboid family serine protease